MDTLKSVAFRAKSNVPFDRLNDPVFWLPMIKFLFFFVITPVVILLIYRSERLQVKFHY